MWWKQSGLLLIWLCLVGLPAYASTAIEPIVVRAKVQPDDIDQVDSTSDSGHFTVITRDRFVDSITTLAEVIESEAGIQVRQSGGLGSYSTVSLRGASEQQVMVFMDGLPLNQSAGGGVDLGRIDLSQVEAIEIYRGRTPVEFGHASLGGAINIRTRNAANQPSSTSLRAGVGSFGSKTLEINHLGTTGVWERTLVAGHTRSDNDFKYVNKNRAFDPSDPNRERAERRRNADFERTSLLSRLGYRHSEHKHIGTSLSIFDQKQGLPQLNNAASSRTRLGNRDVLAQINFSASAASDEIWDRRIRLYMRQLDEDYDDRASQIGLGSQFNRDSTRTTGIDLFTHYYVADFQLITTLNGQREEYQARDMLSRSRSPALERNSLSIASESPLYFFNQRLKLTPGYRGMKVRDRGNSGANFRDAYFTPQGGLKFNVNSQITLNANAGKFVRIPSFFEQFGDRGFLIGNPSLESETSKNFDVGIEWLRFPQQPGILTRSRLELNAFYNEVDDAIAYVFDSRGVGRARNLGDAEIRGTELGIELGFASNTSARVNLTFQDAENLSEVTAFNGKRLPGRFEESYNLRIDQWLGSQLRLFYSFHGERGIFYDSANLLAAKYRDEHDIGLTWLWRQWRNTFEIRNLKDENFQSFNGHPEPGRSFWTNLSYHF